MYRVPTEADWTGRMLVGQQVQIYWDGDDAYYAGRVLSYDATNATHKILYYDGVMEDENLSTTQWKLFDEYASSTKQSKTQNAEDTRNRRAKALRVEQDRLIDKQRRKRDFYLASQLKSIAPLLEKSSYIYSLKRTAILLPLGDPLLDVDDVENGLVPIHIAATENMLRLIQLKVITPDMASFVYMNPGAITLAGGYFSQSVSPPVVMAKASGADFPALLYSDSACIGHTIIFDDHSESYDTEYMEIGECKPSATEQARFAGYVIVWPGNKLSSTVSDDNSADLPELVASGSVHVDISHVYFLEKRIEDGNDTGDRMFYLSALRLQSGTFIPLPKDLVEHTMSFAKHTNIPVNNLISLRYYCNQEKVIKSALRQYCDSRHYQVVLDNVLEKARRAQKSSSDSDLSSSTLISDGGAESSGWSPASISVSLPRDVLRHYGLRAHHIKAAKWMLHMYQQSAPMILRDCSGEGKETEVSAFVASAVKMNGESRVKCRSPILIVCSLMSMLRWLEHLKQVAPAIRVVCLSGSRSEVTQQKKAWSSKQASCLVTTLDVIEEEKTFFGTNSFWSCAVVDQGGEVFHLQTIARLHSALSKVHCKLLLPPRKYPTSIDSGRALWHELNFVAPDIFTDSTLETILAHAMPKGPSESLSSVVYKSSSEDMNNTFQIIDTRIACSVSLQQLMGPDISDQLPSFSDQIDPSAVIGTEKEDTNVSTNLRNRFCNSPSLFLAYRMLSAMEAVERAVLVISQSEQCLVAMEDCCTAKDIPVLRLSRDITLGQELDIRCCVTTSRTRIVYLMLVDHLGCDVEVPPVDTVIICDSVVPSSVDGTTVGKVLDGLRQFSPLMVYRLLDSERDMSIGDSEETIISIENGISATDLETIICCDKTVRRKQPDVVKRASKVHQRSISIVAAATDTVCFSQLPMISSKGWRNLSFCCLCGCNKLPDSSKSLETKYHNHRLINCKLCPRSFHRACFEDSCLPQKELVLEASVCPQHLCACGANSGIMCPCVSCLTVYCENCLPIRDVESIGRRTNMTKDCDFISRNYRYIRCDYCSRKKRSSQSDTDAVEPAAHASAINGPIVLPSQRTPCFHAESDESRKRGRGAIDAPPSDISEDSSLAWDDDMSVDPDDGDIIYFINVRLNNQDLCQSKRMTADSSSTITFLEVLQTNKNALGVTGDLDKYEFTVSAFLTKIFSDDTKIDCSPDDEVVGAIFLGYKYLCFEGHSIVSNKRPRNSS